MILVTGITSGLGKYLHSRLECDGWSHNDPIPSKRYTKIIHCANSKNHYENIDMLERLFSVPCDTFVYTSSVDVHSAFNLGYTGYAMSKLRCEQFVRQSYDNYLILRLGAMVGGDSRPNAIIKMLNGQKVTLSPESTISYMRHESVLPYLDRTGTINVLGNVMKLRDIVEELGLAAPEYGEFPYYTPEIEPTHKTMEELKGYIRDIHSDQEQAQ